MIREFGTPTLFLTFNCAEYESHDIIAYLRTVNNVPGSYNYGKLCTGDPVSVSGQFSNKFHVFFKKVLLKGNVLGVVSHYFWKKEYHTRGVPHYHVLLWIQDAPVIGIDDWCILFVHLWHPQKVLAWIQERITCKLPDKNSDPDLHALVARYQMHKCSAYCKRKVKWGGIFIASCKFNFPRM